MGRRSMSAEPVGVRSRPRSSSEVGAAFRRPGRSAMTRRLLGVLLLGTIAMSSATQGDEPRTTTLGVAGRSNEHATIASSGAFVALTWAATRDATTDIYVAVSRDGGVSFSAPARVNHVEGQARVNGEQPPR